MKYRLIQKLFDFKGSKMWPINFLRVSKFPILSSLFFLLREVKDSKGEEIQLKPKLEEYSGDS